MPRLYREAPLNSIWEGSGNVMCLDVRRALRATRDGGRGARGARGGARRRRAPRSLRRRHSSRACARATRPRRARSWSAWSSPSRGRCSSGSLLTPWPTRSARRGSRARWTGAFGTLPSGVDAASIVRRASSGISFRRSELRTTAPARHGHRGEVEVFRVTARAFRAYPGRCIRTRSPSSPMQRFARAASTLALVAARPPAARRTTPRRSPPRPARSRSPGPIRPRWRGTTSSTRRARRTSTCRGSRSTSRPTRPPRPARLDVAAKDLAQSRGLVRIDLATFATHTFGNDDDATQTKHALTWLEVDGRRQDERGDALGRLRDSRDRRRQRDRPDQGRAHEGRWPTTCGPSP